MSNVDVVVCEVCKKEMASITWKHLQQHSLTLAEYTALFPSSPTRSLSSIMRKKAGATAANANRKGIPRPDHIKQKIRETKQKNPHRAWNKGVPRTAEQNRALSAKRKELFSSGKLIHWNAGRTCPEEVRNKIRSTALAQCRTYTSHSLVKRNITYINKKASGWVHHSTKTMLEKLAPTARQYLNDPDWLYEQHIVNQRTISSICVELGLHWKNSNKTVQAKLKEYGIPVMYWHQSSSVQQRELEEFITSLGVNIETRNRHIIAPLELDIYIPSHRLAIEYCGLYWHTTEYKDPEYHVTKFNKCANVGVRLLTIYSDEWLNTRTLVEQKIRSVLGLLNGDRVFARKCVVKNVPVADKQSFFSRYHLQGNGPSSINLGLYHNNQLVACLGFIKRGNDTYTLNRYATSTSVVGGFSKLLSHFITTYHPREIVTFADRRWSDGNLYARTGFVLDAVIPIDYEYVDGEVRIHKFNYRRKYLPKLLPNFNPNLSETANTFIAGIHRIYDCGKLRYVWRAKQ